MVNVNLIIPVRRLFWRLHGRHLPLILGLLLTVGLLILLWAESLGQPYVDHDFSYSADLQTTLSTYDVASDRYAGNRYALSTFSMQQIGGRSDNLAIIRGTLRTAVDTTETGNYQLNAHAATSSQQYTVQRRDGRLIQHGKQTGQARPSAGQPVTGYLFAPRNLPKGRSFIFWHPVYGAAVTMTYGGETSRDGLPIYQYTSKTPPNLTVNDSSAPAGLHHMLKPRLKLWIEPTSGWLINYQEDSTEFYAPTGSDKPIQPISRQSSQFTEPSIRQHIEYARLLKYRRDFGLQIVPGILLVGALLIVFFRLVRLFKVRYLQVEVVATTVLALSLANLAGWWLHIRPLIVLFPGNVALNPVASICFLAISTGLLLLTRGRTRKLASLVGIFVILVAACGILQIADILPFPVDQLLFRGTVVEVAKTTPDNLSLFGCVALIILGSGLIRIARATTGISFYLAKVLAGIAVTLGAAGLLAKLLLLNEIFVVPTIASLSVSGSLLCILCGVAMLQVLLHHYLQEYNVDSLRHRQNLVKVLGKPILMTAPLIALGVIAQFQQIVVKQHVEASFNEQVSDLQSAITNTLASYTNALNGAKALYGSSVTVERNEWHNYIQALDINHNYPGLQAVGYVARLDAASTRKVGTNVQTVDQLYPGISIYPTGARPTYAPIIYIEPADKARSKLIGYDVATNPARNRAMSAAGSSGKPVISSQIDALQDANQRTSRFALFLPIYTNGIPTNTTAARQQALQGYVYTSFDADRFFGSIAARQKPGVSFRVYDGFAGAADARLYPATSRTDSSQVRPTVNKTTTITADNHPWTITYAASTTDGLSNIESWAPSIILVGGGGLYLLGLFTVLTVLALRRQADAAAAISQSSNTKPSKTGTGIS